MTETPDNAIRICPFIIAVDCSQSMDGESIAAVNQELPLILKEVNDNPAVAELARLGLITFNQTATTVWAISDPQDLQPPTLTASGITDYGVALDAVREMLAHDIPNLGEPVVRRPIVLFMTDGVPSDATGTPLPSGGHERWLRALRRLQDPFPFRPHIACFGFGAAAPEPLLLLTDGDERLVKLDHGGDAAKAVREIFRLVLNTVITVTGGGGRGGGVDGDFFDALMGGRDDAIAAQG